MDAETSKSAMDLDDLRPDVHSNLLVGIGAALYQIGANAHDTTFNADLVVGANQFIVDQWELRCVNKDTGRRGLLTLGFVDGPPEVEVYAESGYWQYCPTDLFGNPTEIIGATTEAFLMMLAVMRVPRIDDAVNL